MSADSGARQLEAADSGSASERLHRLARTAAATSFDNAPPEVRERVAALVLDTLAVTAWGSRRGELVALREVSGQHGSLGAATVFGSRTARPCATACALNGSAAAADQLQDGHRVARGHPATHVVLAVFALAEEVDASTGRLLSAILAGYEVGARLGVAMGGTPTGVHDIGTWGAVAAAVGVAVLLRPGDADAVQRAIELGASALLLTDATTIFGGHTGGHAYLGASVAHGAWLGQAAASGLAAAPGAVDRFFARHAARDWSGLPDLPDAAGGWQDYEVLCGYLKLHPTCAHLHGVLDALEEVRHLGGTAIQGRLTDRVERVHVRTYAAAAAFAAPADNELEARFSIPTAVALALVHGGLTEQALTDEQVRSDDVRSVAARVEVVADPELDARYPDGRPSVVTLALRDGTRVSASSFRPRGDADGAASHDAVQDKAERLLRGAFGAEPAEQLLTVVGDWPRRHTPRELGAAFRRAAAAREAVPAEADRHGTARDGAVRNGDAR